MRAPEMETLARVPHYEVRLARNDGSVAYGAQAYLAEHADAAIRSLRVKLFKERAMTHALNAEYFETRHNCERAARHRRAHSRFAILAELIRAGER